MIDDFLKDKISQDRSRKLKAALTSWVAKADLKGQGTNDWIYDVALATLGYWQMAPIKEPCIPNRTSITSSYITSGYRSDIEEVLIICPPQLYHLFSDKAFGKISHISGFEPSSEFRKQARKRILKEVNKYLDSVEKTHKDFSLWTGKRVKKLSIEDKVNFVYLRVQKGKTQEEIVKEEPYLSKELSLRTISKAQQEMAEMLGIKI